MVATILALTSKTPVQPALGLAPVRSEAHWIARADELTHPVLQRLFRLWEQWRGASPLPPRAAIDPVALKFALGNLLLIDVRRQAPDDAPEYFVRLHGSNLAERMGYNLDRQPLSILPDAELRAMAMQRFSEVVTERRPRSSRRAGLIDDKPVFFQGLVLPFRDAVPDRVDALLVAMIYDD